MSNNCRVRNGVIICVSPGAPYQIRDVVEYDENGDAVAVTRPNKTRLTRREFVGLMTDVRSDAVRNIRAGGETDDTLLNLWEYVGQGDVDVTSDAAINGVRYCETYEVDSGPPPVTIFTTTEADTVLAGLPQEQPNVTPADLARIPPRPPE